MYAHCNRIIKQHSLSMMLVTGPGHGAPANLANLYLEGMTIVLFCIYLSLLLLLEY